MPLTGFFCCSFSSGILHTQVLELKQRIEQEFQLGEVAEQKLMYVAGQMLM